MIPQDAAQAEKILRDFIIENPRIVLDAPDVMRALLATHDETLGQNIVDLRSVAMRRLEAQLGRLEETNRSVIAAAYDNLAGTQQIHRALLKIMEPTDFGGFLTMIGTEMVDILRIDYACLICRNSKSKSRSQPRTSRPVCETSAIGLRGQLPVPKPGGKSDPAQGHGAKYFCLSGSHWTHGVRSLFAA